MPEFRLTRSNLYRILPHGVKPYAATLYHKYLRLSFRPLTRTVRLADGISFEFRIADDVAKAWYGSDEVSPAVQRMVRLVRPGDNIVEAGSHQGYTTLFLSLSTGGQGRVDAFEPDAYCFQRLVGNLKRNRIANVVAQRQAVGAVAGRIPFRGGAVDTAQKRSVGDVVEQVALDPLFSTRPVHLLKVDVEGYEYHALKGARQVLSRRPKLMIELHLEKLAEYGSALKDVLGLLDFGTYLYLAQLGESEEAYVVSSPESVSSIDCDKIQLYGVPREDTPYFQKLVVPLDATRLDG